jgi:hypothetical protein
VNEDISFPVPPRLSNHISAESSKVHINILIMTSSWTISRSEIIFMKDVIYSVDEFIYPWNFAMCSFQYGIGSSLGNPEILEKSNGAYH